MAYTAEQGLPLLIDAVKNGTTHRDYKRVVELAEFYKKINTGEDIGTLMRQFTKREDDNLFAQRKAITQHITPSVCSAIKSPFYKVGRVAVIKREIDFLNAEGRDEKISDLNKAIDFYYGDRSLDKYLENRFVDLNFNDPNSFIVTEFIEPERDQLGNLTAKVIPYPWEVSAEMAVNFKVRNNILQWLIVKDNCTYKQKIVGQDKKETVVDQPGTTYTIYLDNDAIKFTQVSPDEVVVPEDGNVYTVTSVDGSLVQYIRFDKIRVYRIGYSVHKAGRVPAKRIGYKLDQLTNGRTFVSPLDAGVPYIMKMIKTVSELDLTMCLHVFPQKIQYVPKCVGESREIGCEGGKNPSGQTCSVCHGQGTVPVATSAQDALLIRMPKDPKDMIDLNNIMVYKSPPVDLVKFQKEYIDGLVLSAQKAVFNSDVFSRAEISATATEKFIELDNIYDTLFPFAEKFSEVWEYVVKVIGGLRDITDVIANHRFPKDFKFKSVSDLLNELKIANESSAPAYIKQEISRDIAVQQFMDKPEELRRIQVKEKFFPFSGKSSTEIIFIVSNQKTSLFNEVLWSNFEQIFFELETEAEQQKKYFYDYAYELQKELLTAKVNALIAQINAETPTADAFGDTSLEDGGAEQPSNIEAESKAKLKGSVGGVQGILEIQKSVSEGLTDYSAALAILDEIYGIDGEKAKKILGTPRIIKQNDPPTGSATA